jgi:hypothetical protein
LTNGECVELGFIEERNVLDGVVIRLPKAYPVYDGHCKSHFSRIKDWVVNLDPEHHQAGVAYERGGQQLVPPSIA